MIRSIILSAPSVTGRKAANANEKFNKARDQASRWKFISRRSYSRINMQIQSQNYHYGIESLFFLTVDIAGHVLLLRFVTLLPTTFYSTSSIL